MAKPDNIDAVSSKHGFSPAAVRIAYAALRRSNGAMAQFDHRELGGAGQWMPGMIMIGDMFNHALKARVDNLFCDLRNQPLDPMQDSSLPDSGYSSLSYGSAGANDDRWYPPELGVPSTAGSQNSLRYAWFPGSRRLAIELFGRLTIYDTGTHVISGVSQGQSGDGGTITFTSQFGVIAVALLPVVDGE